MINHSKYCKYCDVRFKPKRSDAKYCSHTCRQMDYSKRIEEECNWSFYENEKVKQKEAEDAKLITWFKKQLTITINENKGKSYEENIKQMDILKERFEIKRKESNLNQSLKQCILDLHELDLKEKIKINKISKISIKIKTVWSEEKLIVTSAYKFRDFIEYKLIPFLEDIIKTHRPNPRLNFVFTIPDDFREEMANVYDKIDI